MVSTYYLLVEKANFTGNKNQILIIYFMFQSSVIIGKN